MLAELDQRFENLLRWLDATEPDDDLARPELTDPTMLAGSRVIDAIQPAAYFGQEPLLMAWLSMQALRIWREHGPARPLVGAATGIPVAAVALRNNYAARRIGRYDGCWRWVRPEATNPKRHSHVSF